MRARAWSSGRGSSYGLWVSPKDRDRHFRPEWSEVWLVLPDGSSFSARLTPSFWAQCSEIRAPEIRAWLESRGLCPWRKGSPPQFELILVGVAEFAVRQLSQPVLPGMEDV